MLLTPTGVLPPEPLIVEACSCAKEGDIALL